MAEETPIPHDGWRSRKWITSLAVLGALFAASTTAMFTGVATFDQWASFNQWSAPIILGIAFTTSAGEKALEVFRGK